ncbi:transcriptional repressor [Clavibacter sp. Sh2088]|uniref:transcriptional repressor n=1 Tax=Clavibacter sp. Sh2088 TaxID=3397676 RepID=UPI0039E18CCC
MTWEREGERQAMDASSDFVSAQRLHAHPQDAGSPIGLATVYRALDDLAAEGDADSLTTGVSRETCASPATHAIDI